MRRFALLASLASAAALGALFAPAASADETIRASFSNRFVNPNVTIDQGEPLFFSNGDSARHDVTSTQNGSDGRPLFASPLLSQNQTALVEGSQYLTTGSYPFICSVHPNMQGSVTVTSAGTPVPRPGGGDTTPPEVAGTIRTGSKRGARRAGTIAARVRSNEAATASAYASARGFRITSSSRLSLAAGVSRNRSLRLNRTGRRLLARRGPIRVTVTFSVRDAAGNRAVHRVRKTLR